MAVSFKGQGLCDQVPKMFVSIRGLIQIRFNVKAVTVTYQDGSKHNCYAYDYVEVPAVEAKKVGDEILGLGKPTVDKDAYVLDIMDKFGKLTKPITADGPEKEEP